MQVDINKHIEFRPKRDGRERPFIKGTRVEVGSIVTDSERHGMDAEEISRGYDHVPIAAIHAALAFYHDNRDEVRRMMREDEDVVEQLRQRNSGHTEHGSHDDTRTISP